MGVRRQRHARAGTLKVCALQLEVPAPSEVPVLEAVRDRLLARLLAAAQRRPELIVLPAWAGMLPAIPLAAREDGAGGLAWAVRRFGPEAADIWLDWCRTYARALDLAICSGGAFAERGGRIRHCAWLVDRGGRVLLQQAQTHVTPEEAEMGVAPGGELEVVALGPARVGIALGTDAFYPEVGRILALQGATLVLSPLALPGPWDPWRQRAGAWSQVQGNQVFAVEACLTGDLFGTALEGVSSCLAPVEISPEGDGTLAAAPHPRGESVVVADLDFDRLHGIRRRYPIARHLNPDLYARHLPGDYARLRQPAAGGEPA